MVEEQKVKLLKKCQVLIKKCQGLDRAMILAKKKPKNLTKAELKELRHLEIKLLRWCIK
jgi:hypothetical protein